MSYSNQELTKVAKLYYYSDYTHSEIAGKLGLNRTQVTRMLQAARNRGIVRITIDGDTEYKAHTGISSEIELRYNLKKAIIVPRTDSANYDTHNAVTKSAGDYFDTILKNGNIIGMGWGMSVAGMVRNYFPSQRRDVLFVPVLGGLDEREYIYNLPELSRLAAEKCGGNVSTLYAPAIVDNMETRDTLMNDSNIQKVVRLWSELDILVMGIGALRSKMPQVLRRYLSQHDINLQKLGVACDVCFNFLDKEGKLITTELDRRIIGISYENIRKTPVTMAIAVGVLKAEAIHAVLWSGCIDVLVIDEEAAAAVLDIDKP